MHGQRGCLANFLHLECAKQLGRCLAYHARPFLVGRLGGPWVWFHPHTRVHVADGLWGTAVLGASLRTKQPMAQLHAWYRWGASVSPAVYAIPTPRPNLKCPWCEHHVLWSSQTFAHSLGSCHLQHGWLSMLSSIGFVAPKPKTMLSKFWKGSGGLDRFARRVAHEVLGIPAGYT